MTLRGSSRPSAPPNAEKHELDALLGMAFEEKTVWSGLYESLRDSLFPDKLPPLELTSTPIPVPDRMAVETNRWAVGTATLVNGALLAALLLIGLRAGVYPDPPLARHGTIDLSDLSIFTPKMAASRSGGDGGSNSLTDPSTGRPPKFEKLPIVPPQVPTIQNPLLPVDSAIAVPINIPEDQSIPVVGMHSSTMVTLASNGKGNLVGIGNDDGGGDGAGKGPGYGPGSDNGLSPVGGDVSAPIPMVTPEAEFSDEARRTKFQGICAISLIVDSQGNPQNLRIVRHLGMGLDEKALEAVLRYRFKPARKNGRPVPVRITVEVNFRLY